ncbi:MAG: M28 family peptidase [Ignavibacteria bacterium]|nr:M28 family peptidase [Ignavibacteria bacterium]
MKKILTFFVLLIVFFCKSVLYSQISYNNFVASVMSQVSADSVYKYERQLSGDTSCIIGGSAYTILSRHYSTQGNIKAAQYILEKFQSFGLSAWYQNINSTMINVLAKKTGNKYPNQYVIICAHYDDMPSGTLAPGADDNASGTVAVIEAARLLSGLDLPFTILFAAWDEEERGLLGSKAYADSAYIRGDSIIAVLNFDMIAYDGNNDGALDINTNTGSMSLANEFRQIVNLYQPLLMPQITTSLNGGSDHQSFQQRGYKAILSIEDNSDFTPFYHTVNDAYSSLNKPYFVRMVEAGIAALVTTAGDFKITILHTPIVSGPETGPRNVTAVIRSSYTIAQGSNQPRLYFSVNSGPANFVNPAYSNLDTFRFTIPGQTINSTVKYYLAVQDSDGSIVSTLPSGGSGVNPPGTVEPPEMFQYQVANVYIATIGTGTTSSNFPFATYYMDAKTQYLYLASEINTASSNIMMIGFDVINADPGMMNNFNIRFQNTTVSSLTGFVTTGWTTCYSPTSYTVPGSGWQNIILTQPFQYSGGNLLVEICYDNSAYTQYSTINSTPASGMFWGRYGDLASSSGCATTTWSSSTSPPGRANTRLTFSPITSVAGNSNTLPLSYELKQNYPNPFNPKTIINYQCSKINFVSLKVFDVLGKEVAVIVNEKQSPGTYEVEFDGSGLTSGVYFYRLTSGEFTDTKRMMLIQ